MKIKRIVLINPPYSWKIFPIPVILPGLGYLAETLRVNGFNVNIIDSQLGYTIEDIIQQVKKINPDLIAFSLISFKTISHKKLVTGIREAMPDVLLVAGGPHVSSLRGSILTEMEDLDYGIILDGEQSLLDLIKGMDESQISGLIYRKENEIIINDATLESDLDKIPWPKYEDFELERYGYGMCIVTSRGCPYRCIYCSCNIIGKTFRTRSAQSVVEEIKYWYDKGYREFGLQEDNPTFIKARMYEICQRIIDLNLEGLVLQAGNGLRAEKIDSDLLDQMYKAGFRRIAFGIESASNKVLKAMRKGLTFEQSDNAVRLACEKGFFVSLFFLIGTPGENWSDLEESFAFALKYPVSDVSFYNLVPMPNTELWDYVDQNNLWLRKPDEYLNCDQFPMQSLAPVFHTPELSKEERIRASKKGQMIRAEVTRRVVALKFKKLLIAGSVIAWIYSRPKVRKIENALLAKPWYRDTVGLIRKRIRASFYS